MNEMTETQEYWTLGDFFDAMEKNGYPKAIASYINRDLATGQIIGACAMGQAGLNMDIPPSVLATQISYRFGGMLPATIYTQNDDTKKRVKTIAKELRAKYKDQLNSSIGLEKS